MLTSQEEMKAGQEDIKSMLEACLKYGANPEEMKSVTKRPQ
jgi:hypothetical protein